MLKGFNQIGNQQSGEGEIILQSFSTVVQTNLPGNFITATDTEVNLAVEKAVVAFELYKKISGLEKAVFLETIAEEIMAIGDELIQRAMLETGLPEGRLTGERGRTTAQLKLFADLLREGSWVEAVIDEAEPDRKPLPRADLRKMLVPIGPVAVFGASNFPFAFSTAGGDTASALAAGNPVIVKAHPSHLGTNELMASAITRAVIKTNMPDGVFSFVIGEGIHTGLQLVKHPGIQAVGFTGSYTGGMAIFRAALNERETPVPVYAEMSSTNPVLILPSKLKQDITGLARQLAASITLGAGQFCTNPGLLFLMADESFDEFVLALITILSTIPEAPMLNAAICKRYYKNRETATNLSGVIPLMTGKDHHSVYKATPALLQVDSKDFISNPELQNEIFGPASLVIKCQDETMLMHALNSLHGQLTATVIADSDDIEKYTGCIEILGSKAGRIVFNGVPTGVELSHAMVHGGPFPSTTDARYTSVGTEAIKRFVRPQCLQDCPQAFLPDSLKNENPLHIMRKVNGRYTDESML